MAIKVASRGRIPSFMAMDVLRDATALEAGGEDILHLEIGQPSSGAPAGVIEAARHALETDRIGYTDALGIAPLREALAGWYASRYGVTLPPERFVVTTGSSGGFIVAFLAAFEAGDRVALASPGYPAYRNILQALGIEVVEIPCGPQTRFQPTVEVMEEHGGDLDGLIVASPANPTGTMLNPEEFRALCAWCAAKGVRLISDEIYHGITFGAAGETACAHSDSAVVVNSFSKYFSMTGWRLGWLVLPEDLLGPVECLEQNLFISAPTLSQRAACAAFSCTDELDGHVRRYAANRDYLLAHLPQAGFDRLTRPDGAFYIYADVGHLTNDSAAYCQRMLREAGVAATPGQDFDPARGHTTMRFSFAGAPADMERAVERLTAWRG